MDDNLSMSSIMEDDDRRTIALDLGTRRVGIAVADASKTIATARGFLPVRYNGDVKWMDDLAAFCKKENVDEIVVGLPLHMSGEEGVESERVRATAAEVARRTGCPVVFQDERLSTVTAERVLIEAGMSREKRKTHRDAVAAQVILQEYLDGRRRL
jgi:putative Holliday junction resolvase